MTTLWSYKYKEILRSAITFVFFFLVFGLFAQRRLAVYEEYINRYSDIAVQQMIDYRIPASITLAQGILESGAGKSDLARSSNNHFGIKCHRGWQGEKVYAADDTPNDCFRKYAKVEDSYADHSLFLTSGARYRELFDLRITDYKGWARGLQKNGYATDRAYANKLIKLIEDYELYKFDNKNYRRGVTRTQREENIRQEISQMNWTHQPYKTHGLIYVIAVAGDTYAGIANEFGFKEKDLLRFNEVSEGFPLNEGDIVYFQKKRARAVEPYYRHIVEVGESMYSISQKYGMQLRNLYRLNKKNYEYVPEEGDVLKLR